MNNPPQNKSTPPATPASKGLSLWLKIGLAIVLALVVFVAYVAALPSDFKITRSTVIDNPPSEVFTHVNDFHGWEDWSPWAKLDPTAKNTFSGSESGEGAKFKWSGNDKVGEGQMTILESKPNEKIHIKLDFVRPMENTCDVTFAFDPVEATKTKVTWSMSGKNNFVGKAFCLFMNMDKMVGGDFEKGLASMKKACEAGPPPSNLPPERTTTETPAAEAPPADAPKSE